jgi:hypothetical protein
LVKKSLETLGSSHYEMDYDVNSKIARLFGDQDYRTILEVKSKILKEETINGIGKSRKTQRKKKPKLLTLCSMTTAITAIKRAQKIGMQEAKKGSRKRQQSTK